MTDATALVVRQPMPLSEVMNVGAALAASGFFADARTEAQAVAKILMGHELGISPVRAMTEISIIQGKPTLGANLIAALVKGNPKYDYTVLEMTELLCEIEFFEVVVGERISLGISRFTMEDAKRAGLHNKPIWQQYPRNMLFARAMSNGASWFCPDALGGSLYAPEELEGNSTSHEHKTRTVDPETGEVLLAAPQQYVPDDPQIPYGDHKGKFAYELATSDEVQQALDLFGDTRQLNDPKWGERNRKLVQALNVRADQLQIVIDLRVDDNSTAGGSIATKPVVETPLNEHLKRPGSMDKFVEFLAARKVTPEDLLDILGGGHLKNITTPVNEVIKLVEEFAAVQRQRDGETTHWANEAAELKRFHAEIAKLGYTHDSAKEALHVEHLKDLPLSMTEALAILAERTGAAPQQASLV